MKSSYVLSSWFGWVSSAVAIAAVAAAVRAVHVHAQAPAPSATAIVNARIIDGSGNAPFEGTVVIRGDRIAEVGRSVKPPDGARVIDAQGGTVMPGLVDLVVELPRGAANDVMTRAAAAYLYSGVTTIVPTGLSAAEIDAIRDRLLRAGIKSPRLASPAAPDKLIRGGTSGGSLADAQAFTEWKQNNATYVPVLAAAAPAESRKPTALLEEFGGGAAAAANGGSGGASLSGAGGAGSAGSDAARSPANGASVSGGTGAAGGSAAAGNASSSAPQADPARWKALLDQTRSARDAGIRLGLGSGAGAAGLPHGWSSLLAVRLFADAGITPLQAVTAATSGGAWALGVQSDRGFLAVGQRADLVVVSGDPSASINDIEKIAHVVLGGEVLDRAALRTAIAVSPAAPESTANTTGAKPSTAAPGSSNAAGGATEAAGAVDPKARGAKPTARERAAARKRGAAPAPTSPESTTAATDPAAAPGTTAAAPGTAGTPSPGGLTTASATGAPSSAGTPSAPGATASSAPGAASRTTGASPSNATASASPTGAGATASTGVGASPSSAAGSSPSNGAENAASPGAAATMAAAIVAASPMIDDFEGGRDASTVGSAWSSAAESATTSTTVVMGRVVRGARDHALNVTARMGDARDSQARVTVRVAQDGRPLDVSRFHGLRFDARGQGRYRIIFISRGITDGRYHESNFSGSPLWTPVNIPFASVGQNGKGERTPWTGRDLVEIVFLFARDPGDFGYLELDNLRFY